MIMDVPSADLSASKSLSSLQQHPLNKKHTIRNTNLGLIARGVALSFGVSQLLGTITAITQIASGVFNIGKLANQSIQISKLKGSIKAMEANPECKENALKQMNNLMNGTKAERENTVKEIKQNIHRFIGGLLGLFPGLGLISAGVYLNSTSPQIYSGTKIEQAAASVSETFLIGGAGRPFTGLIEQTIFPYARSTSEIEGRRYLDEMNASRMGWIESGELEKDEPFVEFLNRYNKMFNKSDNVWTEKLTKDEIKQLNEWGGNPNLPLAPKLCKKVYEISVRDKYFDALQPEEVLVNVDRGDRAKHKITCHYSKSDSNDDTSKTMILFHGNAMIGPQMSSSAARYKEQGWNVLMVTMGGYPGSDEGLSTNETTAIQDVNAILRFVESKGVETIGVHGFSLGASLAMHATKLSDKVQLAVLDKPFDSAPNVAANSIRNIAVSESLLPAAMIRGAMGAALPANRKVPGVPSGVTDGCDNVKKAGEFKGKLIVIGGKYDHLMGEGKSEKVQMDEISDVQGDEESDVEKKYNNRYPNNCSEKIFTGDPDNTINFIVDEPHYSLDKKNAHLLDDALTAFGFS